mgnify:CR=1 FL=1
MKKWVKMGLMAVLASSLCVSMTACKSDKKANNSAVQKEKAVKNNADADKQKTYTLFLGEQYELEEKEKAEYVIADTSVASVSPEGIVHACKAGKTTITVTKDGKKSSSALKIKKRGMVYPTFTMMKGEKLPILFSNKESSVSWTSADETIATVDADGVVTGKKVGTTTIYGKGAEHTYRCDLTVNKKVKNIVYLTFDDGPNRYTTPKVLDILKENNVKATFFLLGKQAEAYPDIVKRMHKEGHMIGNHSYDHVNLANLSKTDAAKQIRMTSEAIHKITGEYPQYLRPPFGNEPPECSCAKNMMTVLWDVDPLDWCCGSSSTVIEKVVKAVEEDDIILLHDASESSVEAALGIIDALEKQGYEFVTVDEVIFE